jgi:hypothetical protein
MGLLEQQNFLARLYTDEAFRGKFLSKPDSIGQQFHLLPSEINEITEIIPNELSFFSDSLIWKRLREVEKMLPLTAKALGNDLESKFREFSSRFNPLSVKKHVEDALAFCEWLNCTSPISDMVRDMARFEHTKLGFHTKRWYFAFCFLEHDPQNPESRKGSRRRLAVWLRLGTKVRFLLI